MKQKNQKRRWLSSLVFACLCMVNSSLTVKAETYEEKTLPVIEISLTDADPLSSLKKEVLENRQAAGLLDLDSINVEESTIQVDHFESEFSNLMKVDVSMYLVSKDEDAITPISVSFTESILLKMVESENPELILKSEDVTVHKGDSFKAAEQIGYVKDSTGILPALVEEDDVDTSKPGTYQATYTAINTLGRTTIRTLDVTVVDKPIRRAKTISLEECQIADDGSIEAMFEAINAVRAANGLHAYQLADDLGQAAAAIRAQEAFSYLSHHRPDGRYYQSVFSDLGMDVRSLEILVMCGNSVQSNLNWWMNEPGHARIVLNPTSTTIAIGHYGSMWAAEVYY